MGKKYYKCLVCKEIIREDEPCQCMKDVKDIAKMYEANADEDSPLL